MNAQFELGIRNGNFAGINGASMNPSFIVDGRLSWDVNIGSGSFTFDNTFLYIPKDSLKFLGFGNIIDQVKAKGYFTRFEPNDPYKKYDWTYNMEGLGPSFMVNFAKKHAIGFTTGARYYMTASDVPGHQAENAYREFRDTSLWGIDWVDNTSRVNLLGWFEYGLTYAVVLYNKDKSELKGGITGKYLDGVAGAYIKNTNETYNIIDEHDLFLAGSIDYGRTEYDEYDFIHKYSDLIHGNGFGGSIGFTYVRKKDSADYTYEMNCKKYADPNKSNYKYRIGLSLIDLGSVKFDKNAATFHLETNSVIYPEYRSSKYTSNYNFDTTISQVIIGFPTISFVEDNFKMALPTALTVQGDWNFYKSFYLNATIVKAFGHSSGQGVKRPDVYSITPRFENKWFEFSVPMSLLYYHELKPRIGFAVRAGNFFIGGDAWGGLFGIHDFEGADFYGGVHFFLPGKKLKDTDGDLVSDKMDSCLLDKGPCATYGCPDRDKDGVIDKLDRCPDVKGLFYLKGCPDADSDSIPDLDDQCPDEPGLREFAGCPDRDGDKIIDKIDSCPDVPGLAEFAGCPDRDGDKIIDKNDSCPDVKGILKYHGCPEPPTPPAPPVPPAQIEITGVLFKINSSILDPSTFSILDKAAEIMKANPNSKWSVIGYTDITGRVNSNLILSKARANTVTTYLGKRGVNLDSIVITDGKGIENPIANNNTEAGRIQNRRVEIKEVK